MQAAGVSGRATGARARLAPTLALTVTWIACAAAVLAALAHELIAPTELPPPFTEQNQDAENLVFVLTFAVLIPAALLLVPRVADRISSVAGTGALSALAALAAGSLTAMLVAVRILDGDLGVVGLASLAWGGAAALVLAAAARGAWRVPAGMAGTPRGLWIASALLLLALVLTLTFLDSIDVAVLVAGGALAGGASLLLRNRAVPTARRPWGALADGGVCALVLLAVCNLVIFDFGRPVTPDDTILQFHQNFFLGPANQVVGGGAMLVDTLSQYGVGSIVFLAGAFEVLPIGNGMLGLIEGVLASLAFMAAYGVLRLCDVSRPLAACAIALGVFVLALAAQFPIGGLLQHGAIRFGLPAGLLLAAVWEARRPERTLPARALALTTIGVASIWALEAFAYTLLTAVALLAFGAWGAPQGERRAWLGRRLLAIAAACAAAHLLFAGLTLAAAGELPDWGKYIETLRAFLTGGVGELTFDFSPWSPALGTGALYAASAAAIVLVVRLRPEIAREERVTMLALSGSTAYGIALLSYYVNRSGDHIVAFISLPALLVWVLWFAVLRRRPGPDGPPLARAATFASAVLALLLVSVGWSAATARLPETALAHVIPGGESMREAVDRLREPPAIADGAAEAERLLEAEMPGEEESIVLTTADLGVEALVRSGRINRIPLADPWEESLVPSEHLAALEAAIDGLDEGERVLIDEESLELFVAYRREPGRDPLTEPFSQATLVPSGVAILQEWVLDRIGERFSLEPVVEGEEGLLVAELRER